MDSSDYIQGHFDGYNDARDQKGRDISSESAQYRQGYHDGKADYWKIKRAEDRRKGKR